MNKYFLTLAVVVGFALGVGFQATRLTELKLQHKQELSVISDKTIQAQDALLKFQEAVKKAEFEKDNKHHERVETLKTDVAAADAALDSWLRKLSESSSSSNSSLHSATNNRRESVKDQATFDLFIDMLAGNSKELVAVGKYADELRVAGLRCEDKVDAYTNPQVSATTTADKMK